MTEVATTYGQAMYDLARDEGKSQQILAELSALDQSLSNEPGFIQLLSAPISPRRSASASWTTASGEKSIFMC